MQTVVDVVNFIIGCGASVMLPIIIFIFAMIMRADVKKAFVGAVTIGVVFIGINLVTGTMGNTLGPVAQGMTGRIGLNLSYLDIGWPAMSSIAWAWTLAGLMIPLCLIVNLIMLALKWTKTMDVDIWNYWQFVFIGSIVSVATDSQVLGVIACCLSCALALVLGDYMQPFVDKYFDMPGISFPHLTALGFLPIVIPLNWLLDKIPGIDKLYADPETIRKKFGVFGEPIIMGLVIGLVIGILGTSNVQQILVCGMTMAAVMYLMPKMVACLMEGLIPISEAASSFMQKKFEGRELFIGLDAAVALGEPSVIAVGLIMVPITILLAFVIPGNKMMPMADLAVIPFIVCLITAMCKGNVIRAVIVSTVVMALVLVFATDMAPFETIMAKRAGVSLQGATTIGNLDRANFITWAFFKIFSLFA